MGGWPVRLPVRLFVAEVCTLSVNILPEVHTCAVG